ncbi:hypothetical protein MCG98_13840 [Ruminococcus sp. OA3]|uniref:hypothetical protein n=1 Tax=Ruminococcus sp. OA3 TaxID=2914164 RepID=UPI001F053EB6|nr:hypothetical protein [Ruminococcus sp. OA3]MCH1983650.1 hypothetical protein [Ruminococcus sp. OA3]
MGGIPLEIAGTLPRVTVTVKRMKHGEQLKEQYSGYEVRRFRESWDGVQQVEFESEDGMVTAVPVREILSDEPGERMILADSRNNVLMCARDGSVRYRLVAEGDDTGRRWCRDIIEVEFVEE